MKGFLRNGFLSRDGGRSGNVAGLRALAWLAVAVTCLSAVIGQDDMGSFSPDELTTEKFDEIRKRSPFLRTLDFTNTYRLRALATINGKPVAMLFNRETEEVVQVSTGRPNDLGMQLIEIEAGSSADPGKVSVRLSIGGEEVSLSYDEAQLSPQLAARAPDRRDSKGRLMPPQTLMDNYRSATREQQERYQRWKRAYLEKYPDQAHSRERYELGLKVIDSIKSGKPIPKLR